MLGYSFFPYLRAPKQSLKPFLHGDEWHLPGLMVVGDTPLHPWTIHHFINLKNKTEAKVGVSVNFLLARNPSPTRCSLSRGHIARGGCRTRSGYCK